MLFPHDEDDFDTDKIDDAVLALLWLQAFKQKKIHPDFEAWRNFRFDLLDRLREKELLYPQTGKEKTVSFTAEGEKLGRELCQRFFGKNEPSAP